MDAAPRLRRTASDLGAHVITVLGEWTRLGTPPTNEFKVYTTDTGTNKKPTTEATNSVSEHVPVSGSTFTAVPV